jgi:hypothetical protein
MPCYVSELICAIKLDYCRILTISVLLLDCFHQFTIDCRILTDYYIVKSIHRSRSLPLNASVRLSVYGPQVHVAVAERIVLPENDVLGVNLVRKHQAPATGIVRGISHSLHDAHAPSLLQRRKAIKQLVQALQAYIYAGAGWVTYRQFDRLQPLDVQEDSTLTCTVNATVFVNAAQLSKPVDGLVIVIHNWHDDARVVRFEVRVGLSGSVRITQNKQ